MIRMEDITRLTFLKRTRGRRFCFSFCFIFCLLSLGLYCIQLTILTIRYYNPPAPPTVFSHNYFLSSEDMVGLGYLIHTPSCSILNLTAWDESIMPVLLEEDIVPPDCVAIEPRLWTYTNNSHLFINETAMLQSGYSPSSISCCYYTIHRMSQTIDKYDINADSTVRYSSECTALTEKITEMRERFIRVHCKAKYWLLSSDILYRRFHPLALLPETPKVTEKVTHWKTSPQVRPPNVLIVGIDSMSRNSFHRTMPRTRKVLEDLGAVEMLGHTKVGENTFPNLLVLLSGYSEDEIRSSCLLRNEVSQDECNHYYIWSRFSQAKYLTSLVEDSPRLAAFNYIKTGFVMEPTDFYLRPFKVSVHERIPSRYFEIPCLGPNTVDQVLLRYVGDVITTARSIKETTVPYFSLSWETNLAHGNPMSAKYGDETHADFLRNLNLTNTIMLFMSDHGYRFGSIRQTFAGWYEDKLPNLWIYLPPSIRRSHPHWLNSLRVNSRRLTSPYDLFWTLTQVLDEFSQVPQTPPIRDRNTKKEIQRRYGQSLFTQVPLDRKCSQVGIISTYCACYVPKRLPVNDTHLQPAAEEAITEINSQVPTQCAQFKLLNVDAGAQIQTGEDTDLVKTFVVAFKTNPGEFMFEATVRFYARKGDPEGSGTYRIYSAIQRLNKISTDVSCVRDAFLERLCYCKPS